jgi:hypothetical protein
VAVLDSIDRALAAPADHELLQGPPLTAGVDPRAHRAIAHRQHACAETERGADLRLRGGLRASRCEHLRAVDRDREVAVAEVEPDVVAELA